MNEFLWPVRVYYEDTDAGGVVYYANYLRFMERARTEWLRKLGFEQDELIAQHDVLFAVRRVQVDYRQPARFNDSLVVSVKVVEAGKASLTFAQAICRESDNTLLCEGKVKIASLEASSFKPRPIPASLQQQL
ncbi:tol-pal system-associated acyl-CoA thioesterase [Thiohalophilus thiocyanatoxydans]|uniref:Acyl-CoA thioester hydrolase n=1 Tax=Thiohalophilus thiocyanatoxydans TaxID=381308 RepID=A0A4R8IMK0_9GAMM|nr:tol-pal system-associated acyl-CoA thioesterase [Thiohalophilus thiocyanatoxydans]TDY01668.1 acyl-CoA thioester hydrolase [Thiohalophilus thiocyanatoxydans]